ncbi:threonine/serine ThrE exporter family protein [Methylobacterium oryzihabitans]|uniref:Threonine/serine exporter family protein n=1 Tax=Methylobacterium oryzihabitans TaxID=2499852 RepID=A0A437NVQ2_9HYPH|nr:threonine/serine exporter family protein [Methylobacterium oryzihabitans]RVU14110.1 threonine/serine exporter family protein [Methylobacterium oryzihabitans]
MSQTVADLVTRPGTVSVPGAGPGPTSAPSEAGASPDLAAHLALRVGRLLLVNGADTRSALARMEEVGALAGHRVRALALPEGVIVTAGDGPAERTRLGRTIPALGVDMARLGAVEGALDEVRAGTLDATGLDARLDAAERAQGHPGWLVAAGVGVTAAALARLFGADWPVVAAAFAAGLVSTVLRRRFAAGGLNPFAATLATALVSGLVAVLLIRLAPGTSAVLGLTAAGMILVPGVPLVNGVRDLVTGHVGTAVARLATGAATVLAIGFALVLAAGLTGAALPVGEAPGRLPVWQDLVFSAAAAIGYALLFNVPARLVPICMACSMASHGLRTALAESGVDLLAGSALGALAAGVVAGLAATRCRVPAVTFAFPGIVAMIPGSYGFRAAIGGLHLMTEGAGTSAALVAETVSLSLTTAAMTVAIGIGLVVALALVPGRPASSHLPPHGA